MYPFVHDGTWENQEPLNVPFLVGCFPGNFQEGNDQKTAQ